MKSFQKSLSIKKTKYCSLIFEFHVIFTFLFSHDAFELSGDEGLCNQGLFLTYGNISEE